ncbi:hypothetical protein BY458DRAFT_224954 [Sporodiniella umbellata]|nr:hypothetical protein BY458DRAFT_224954 [Sporodiniella umbellata]
MQADTSVCSHHIRFSYSSVHFTAWKKKSIDPFYCLEKKNLTPFHCFYLESKTNTVSCEEACCIFFCKKFNEENVKICIKRVEKMMEVEICYQSDPIESELVCEARMFGAPGLFNIITEACKAMPAEVLYSFTYLSKRYAIQCYNKTQSLSSQRQGTIIFGSMPFIFLLRTFNFFKVTKFTALTV